MGDVIWDDGCYWTFTTYYSLFRHGRVQVICRFIYLGGLWRAEISTRLLQKRKSKRPCSPTVRSQKGKIFLMRQLEPCLHVNWRNAPAAFFLFLSHTHKHILEALQLHIVYAYMMNIYDGRLLLFDGWAGRRSVAFQQRRKILVFLAYCLTLRRLLNVVSPTAAEKGDRCFSFLQRFYSSRLFFLHNSTSDSTQNVYWL